MGPQLSATPCHPRVVDQEDGAGETGAEDSRNKVEWASGVVWD
jgi:hypothetical protein